MSSLPESRKQELRDATVDVVMELRRAYLMMSSCSVLKHWTQIQERLRAAARTTESVEEWSTKMCRSLGLACLGTEGAGRLVALKSIVGDDRASWLDLLEKEYGAIMAAARLRVEEQKRLNRGVDK